MFEEGLDAKQWAELDRLADQAHEYFLGKPIESVLGICLSGACTAAEALGMSGTDLQTLIGKMWDRAHP